MSSGPRTGADDDARLGALVDQYQRRRDADPAFSLDTMREEAGDLFDQLVDLVGGLDLLHACFDGDTRVPESIGPHRIRRILGRGATGVVYETEDGLALKVLRPTLALTPGGLARFRREFEAAKRLDHEHIVKVLDQGEADGRLYIVMEKVDGVPLSELKGRLDARRARALFAPVARALAHAGRAGLLHRDLKPGNLILGRDGRLMVTDFGVAKLAGETLTATNAVLGTPGFLSPEQAAGRSRDVDARTDVYGLGAAIDFVAPGQLPDIVARCMQERPEDRYADADALADDLERRPGRARVLLALALVLVASAVWHVPPAPAALPAVALPRDEPPPPRGPFRDARPPAPTGALEVELARYPERNDDAVRRVIARFFEAELYADAYAATELLSDRNEARRLALFSLWGLGMRDTELYRGLYVTPK